MDSSAIITILEPIQVDPPQCITDDLTEAKGDENTFAKPSAISTTPSNHAEISKGKRIKLQKQISNVGTSELPPTRRLATRVAHL